MIKSMTGFGRAEASDGKRNIVVEMRSINHRYCDITVKMPRRYAFAEESIKTEVKRIIKRGKLDVSVMVENTTDSDINIRLNTPVAEQYYDNLRRLQKEFDVSGDISLEYLASMPDVLKPIPNVEDESDITRAILGPVRLAAQKLDEMRITEGGKLAEDLLSRGSVIQGVYWRNFRVCR